MSHLRKYRLYLDACDPIVTFLAPIGDEPRPHTMYGWLPHQLLRQFHTNLLPRKIARDLQLASDGDFLYGRWMIP